MMTSLKPEHAIAAALAYGSNAQLAARHRRWQRREAFLCYVLPGLLMLVDLGMIAGPVLFGQVALAHADMLSVLFCLLPLGAFLSNCLSTQTNEDFRCYPLGTYVNSGNMCLYMESLGARQLRDAVLASGRKLHWVDMDLMERVIAYERAQGKRTPA